MYLSIDVGIKNLAFCLFCNDKQNEPEIKIIKWDVINLSLSNSSSVTCCIPQTSKKNKESVPCKSPVKYFK